MRLLLATATWVVLMVANSTLAQNAPVRLDQPRVKGQPVDHCADIEGQTDCSARGEAKAAMKACVENGFSDQAGSHWRAFSGNAMHYVTEYDMHAGEVGGRWVEQPTNGTFDWITCKK